MYKKEIERKFLVDKTKMPNLSQFECLNIKQGYLSQQYDSLTVRIRSTNDKEFILELKDSGSMVRNELGFTISREEFNDSYILCGQKVITKKRYLVPSEKNNGKILEVDVYDDFNFITCEYEGESVIEVEALIMEDWFTEDVTQNNEYSNKNLAFSRIYKKV